MRDSFEAPPEHYAAVGRVAVAAAKLEAMAGLVAHKGLGPLSPVSDWESMSAAPGRAMRELERVAKLPGAENVATFRADVAECLNARNRIVHGLLYAVFPEGPGEDLHWVLYHPKSRADLPLPDESEVGHLVTRMNALSARAIGVADLAARCLADSVRTEGES